MATTGQRKRYHHQISKSHSVHSINANLPFNFTPEMRNVSRTQNSERSRKNKASFEEVGSSWFFDIVLVTCDLEVLCKQLISSRYIWYNFQMVKMHCWRGQDRQRKNPLRPLFQHSKHTRSKLVKIDTNISLMNIWHQRVCYYPLKKESIHVKSMIWFYSSVLTKKWFPTISLYKVNSHKQEADQPIPASDECHMDAPIQSKHPAKQFTFFIAISTSREHGISIKHTTEQKNVQMVHHG